MPRRLIVLIAMFLVALPMLGTVPVAAAEPTIAELDAAERGLGCLGGGRQAFNEGGANVSATRRDQRDQQRFPAQVADRDLAAVRALKCEIRNTAADRAL